MLTGARNALILAAALVLLGGNIGAQSNFKVVTISIEGNRIATSSLILGVSSFHLGSPLTQTSIQETMHSLYRLGLFSDVRIDGEEVEGGLRVIIVVKEFPKLSGLDISGNKKIKTKDLKESIGLGVGGYISPFLVHKGKQTILEQYAEKGYFQAKVTETIEYNEDSTEATLNYKITENSKVKVKKVVMTGNVRVEADELIGKMRNRKRGFLKSSDFAQDEYEEDLKKVIAEYHKRGFIDAFLISDSISIDEETNRMTIYLEVYEGSLYYFGDVTFAGQDKMPLKALEHAIKFKKGEEFDAEKYDESLFEIYTTYQEIGHLHTRVIDEKKTVDDSIINVTYNITEGLPSHIRYVNIVGNRKTKDKVIRRELKVFPGQVFNRSLLIRSVRDAMSLNYFANVEPVPVNLPNGDVDLEFKIEEKQTGQISAGAGYNSQDKLVGSLGMGIPNLAGNGQNLSFNVDFGKRRNSFNVSFTEPYMFGRPTLFGTDIFILNRRWFSDYTEGRQGGSIRFGKRLRWPDNYFRAFASYRLERNRFHDFSDSFILQNSYKRFENWDVNSDGIFGNTDSSGVSDTSRSLTGNPIPGSVLAIGDKWNTASRFSLTITRDSRNLPEFATKGSLFSYTFSQTGGLLGGFWQYQKHNLSLAKFIPVFWKFALAAKVQFAGISSPSALDETILISDRFTPGGTSFEGIVRGFEDGSLTPDSIVTQTDTVFYYTGPVNENTLPDSTTVANQPFKTRVRGNFMLITNLELQFPIAERSIYGLFFFDAGNSWLRWNDIHPVTGLYAGAGAGFRIVVPGIGTIGFDFGYPLQQPPNGEKRGWKPHFQIGTTFR